LKKISLCLLLFTASLFAAEVKTITIPSTKMKKDVPATLILPDSYKDGKQKYPVLYLLHGAGDNHQKWSKATTIADLADQYQMIVLCPDGGGKSWFFDSPIDPNFQYETHVAKECVAYIDSNYRSKAQREFRATCGLSMGGHGSMFLAIRHQKTFSIAVPLSGGVDIRPFAGKWEIKKRLGEYKDNKEIWEELTVINLAKQLKNGDLAISIDCGDKDFFLKVNRNLRDLLKKNGVTHNYEEHPGAHNWNYWKEAIKRQMPFIDKHFKKAIKK
jgi:S-formylglutathione hydrolase FrmB